MKKNLLLTSVILASFALVGCNTPEPEPEPGPEEVKVTGITTTEADINLLIGEQHALVYTVAPENATNKAVTFTEDSEFIDIVEDKVVGLAAGEAKITATTVDGGFTVEYNVVVEDAYNAFPKAEVEAFYEAYELDFDIVPFAVASEKAYYEFDDWSDIFDVVFVYANEATEEEFYAYAEAAVNAGWEVYDYDEETGDYILRFNVRGETKAMISLVYYPAEEGHAAYASLMFGFEEPTTSIPFSTMADNYKNMGIEGVVVPDYTGEDLDYEYDEDYGVYFIYESNATEFGAFVEALVEAGWVVQAPEKEGQTYDTYKFGETRALVHIYNFLEDDEMYNAVAVQFDVEPLPGFPTDEINALFTSFGITDEMVTYDGAEAYLVFPSATSVQVQMTVAEGTMDQVITDYAEALIVAGFTAGEPDQYGTPYTSPNGQFIVQVCPGTSWGETYTTLIVVNVELTALHVFPREQINDFLEEYGLGFSISEEVAAQLADPEGNGYTVESGADSGYHYFFISVDGDQAAAFEAVLVPVLTAAGYIYDEDLGCYYEETNYHQVNIAYNSTQGYTYVILWE